MAYDDTFRQEMIALADEIINDVQGAGLTFYATHQVFIRTTKYTNYDETIGKIENPTETFLELLPRPKVTIKTQYRQFDGELRKVGDVKIEFISRTYTPEQLLNTHDPLISRQWRIDNVEYSLVDGYLIEEPNGLYYSAILQREQQALESGVLP